MKIRRNGKNGIMRCIDSAGTAILRTKKVFSAKKVSKSHFCIKFKAIHLINNILPQWYFSFLFTKSIIKVSLKYHKSSIESSSKHHESSENIKTHEQHTSNNQHLNTQCPSSGCSMNKAGASTEQSWGIDWTYYGHRVPIRWETSAQFTCFILGNITDFSWFQ